MTSPGLLEILFTAAVFSLTVTLTYSGLLAARNIRNSHRPGPENQTALRWAEIFPDISPQQLLRLNILAVFLGPALVYAVFDSLAGAAALVAVMLLAPRYIYNHFIRRRMSLFDQQLPDAMMMLSGGIRSGASLSMAIESVVAEQYPPLSQEFNMLLREIKLGSSFDNALVAMLRRMPTQDLNLVVSAIRISREVGGDLGEILDTLADTLRRKKAMEGKIESLTAQGKLQGIVMTGLPVLLMLALFELEPQAMAPLFNTKIGYMALSLIVTMLGLGYFFINKITAIDV